MDRFRYVRFTGFITLGLFRLGKVCFERLQLHRKWPTVTVILNFSNLIGWDPAFQSLQRKTDHVEGRVSKIDQVKE